MLSASPVISEFVASNNSSFADGFGEDPDWIEIHNPTDSSIDLVGYHLTDDPANLTKWEFPTSTIVDPGGWLVVFASSRETIDPAGYHHTNFNLAAGGGYLALTAPDQSILSEFGSGGTSYPPQITDISFGVTGTVLVDGRHVSELLIPADDLLGESWTSNSFDALGNGFSLARAAIGYENSPGSATSYAALLETTLPSGTTNAYLRSSFELDDASQISDLHLRLYYDDGVVVYLNGTRLLSENAPDPLTFDSPATAVHDDAAAIAGVNYDLSGHVGLLETGINTLAIHALNRANSSDFLMIPELVSQSISGEAGYLLAPTPGMPNSLGQQLGPLVETVTPSLPVAQADQPLTISAAIFDFTRPLNPATVRLHYRVMYGPTVTVTMVDDGTAGDAVANDGLFSAQIPSTSLAVGEMVRWYITAADTDGIETRAPRFLDALDSPQYYGTVVADPAITTDLPVLQWFLENPSAASTNLGTRASLWLDGEFFDNIQVDNHGQSTRGSAFPKKSFDFDANSGIKFRIDPDEKRVSDFNLLTNYADQTKLRNTLEYDLFAQAGYAHHLAFPVMVYRNGSFYGLYDLVEEGDTEYLDRLGLVSDNPLYKVNNRLDHAYNNVEKKSREYEDHSDFQQVVTAAQTLSGGEATAWDYDNLDIADLVNYLAIHAVTVSSDFGHKNMYWFRDTLGTGLWSVFPWDQDLSLGHQWDASVSPPYFKDELVTDLGIYRGGNNIFQRQYADPRFREMFVRRVRSLSDQYYGEPGSPTSESYLATQIVHWEGLIAEEAIEDTERWGIHPNFTRTPAQAAQQLLDEFIPLRRQFLDDHPDVPAAPSESPLLEIDPVDFDADPSSGLQTEEYIRINNLSDFAVDLSGWRLADGIEHVLKPGTVIPAGESLYVVKNVKAFLNRSSGPGGGQQLFIQGNYGGQLTFTGETVQLVDPAGQVHSELVTPAGSPTPNQQYLRITEVHYHPSSGDTEFIELMNISRDGVATTLDLSGVSISEGPSQPFVFAEGTTLGPGQRLLVVEHRDAMLAAYPSLSPALIVGEYAGQLSNGGERIKLVDSGAATIVELDYRDGDPWPLSADGHGASMQLMDEWGTPRRRVDKPTSWRGSARAGGSPGTAPQAVEGIRINEVLAHTDAPLVDSIELHNITDEPIDVSGWYLSDSGNQPLKFELPAGSVIGPRSYLVFDETDFNPTPLTPAVHHFALSGSHGDSVWLVIPDASGTSVERFVDQVEFGGSFNGVSLGRLPNGSGRLVPLGERSLGSPNGPAAVSPVVISEFHYHPPNPSPAALAIDPTITSSDLEFIELFNHGPALIDLGQWRLRGDRDFDFASQSIDPQAALVLVSFDPADTTQADRMAAFRAHHGIDDTIPLAGPMSGSLDNSYGLIKLQRPDEAPVDEPTVVPQVLVDEVFYDDQSPWPEAADGDGDSLHRIHHSALGNAVTSWRGRSPTPGVAGFIPRVTGVEVNGGAATRSAVTSLRVAFDLPVNLSPSAFLLHNRTENQVVAGLDVVPQIVDGTTVATITFLADPLVESRAFGGNTLTGGEYQLTVMATGVSAMASGLGMPEDFVFGDEATDRFFRRYGDTDGSRLVDLLDFAAFRGTFGSSEGELNYRGDLDHDGNGMIDLLDFARFRANFGTG